MSSTRAITVVFTVIMLSAAMLMAWTHVVEPIGQSELTECAGDKYNCDSVKTDIYRIGGQYAPLVLIGGFVVWALAWVVRQTRTTTRGPGGGLR